MQKRQALSFKTNRPYTKKHEQKTSLTQQPDECVLHSDKSVIFTLLQNKLQNLNTHIFYGCRIQNKRAKTNLKAEPDRKIKGRMFKWKQFILFMAITIASFTKAVHFSFLSSAKASDSSVVEFPIEKNNSNIDLLTTVKTMNEISVFFAPLVRAKGTPFAWDFDWTKPWIGAGSKKNEGVFSIMLWGGYVRADFMTVKALQFTICHEFGHFLGGEPFQYFDNDSDHWSSVEGQADWWAATVCLPTLYRSQGQTELQVRNSIHQAGLDFALFAQFHFHESAVPVSLEKRATEKPEITIMLSYPSLQCRLDTVRNGGDCSTLVFQDGNQKVPVCERPRCWYVPTSDLKSQ